MTSVQNLDKLSPLQRRAAQLVASGLSDTAIKDDLVLSITTWESWRSDPIFVAACEELKLQASEGSTPAGDEDLARVDEAIDELSK